MAIADVTNDGEVFLITGQDSEKVSEIQNDGEISLCCQNDSGNYVTLSGVASLDNDKLKIRSLWKSEFDTWFPDGSEQTLLIKIEPNKGEFWNLTGLAKAQHTFNLGRSNASDKKQKTNHRSVSLS
jgi:general stress protein 26